MRTPALIYLQAAKEKVEHRIDTAAAQRFRMASA